MTSKRIHSRIEIKSCLDIWIPSHFIAFQKKLWPLQSNKFSFVPQALDSTCLIGNSKIAFAVQSEVPPRINSFSQWKLNSI
jgi:hypothetical protein